MHMNSSRRTLLIIVDVLLACCAIALVGAIAWFPVVWSVSAARESRQAAASLALVRSWPQGKVRDEYRRAQEYNRQIAASDQSVLGEFEDPFGARSGRASGDSLESSETSHGIAGDGAVNQGDGNDRSSSLCSSSPSTTSVAHPESRDDATYQSLLNDGTGAMGSISIPKISVNMPIYHGTSDEALRHGAGHLYGTSLPVGGASTNAVISGHRGLTNALMFTRLDELKRGDFLYIHTLDRVMGYQVTGIHVIDPADTRLYRVVPGRDLVTLMTCTPYGVNTQRLVITAERRPIPDPMPSLNRGGVDPLFLIIAVVLPVLILPILVWIVVHRIRRRPLPVRHRSA